MQQQQSKAIVSLQNERVKRAVDSTLQRIETLTVDPEVCHTCKTPISDTAHGWVYTTLLDETTGYKSIIAPCPACAGDVHARNEARRRAVVLSRLFGGANIPFQYKNWTFANFPGDSQALQQVRAWLRLMLSGDEDHKRGLYLQGVFGTGKTSLAISALKEILEAEQAGLFITTTELLMRIRACYRKDAEFSEDEVLRALTETPFVVIDDLGAEKPSEDAVKQIYYILDTRLSKGLYTIITSNRSVSYGADCLEVYWGAKAGSLNAKRAIERLLQHCEGISVRGRNQREK